MLAADKRDQRKEEARQHALFVSGVAKAVRATPEDVNKYVKAWMEAKWLEEGATSEQTSPPPEPDLMQSLIANPYLGPIVTKTLRHPDAPTPETPTTRPLPPAKGYTVVGSRRRAR